MNDCPRFGRWIRGCHFEPRYDFSIPEGFKLEGFSGTATGHRMLMDNMRNKVYVADVCTSCGKVVPRQRTFTERLEAASKVA